MTTLGQSEANTSSAAGDTDATWLDRLGTRWRIAKVRPFIEPRSRVLDIGCGDGALFRSLGDLIDSGVGVDPEAPELSESRFQYVRGTFPFDLGEQNFDVAVALAVLEHIPDSDMPAFIGACYRYLRTGGRMVLTVPSPIVDHIVGLEQRLHLAKAPGLHQHHGFDPTRTCPLFEAAGFTTVRHRRFQLGMNNLFVFAKASPSAR